MVVAGSSGVLAVDIISLSLPRQRQAKARIKVEQEDDEKMTCESTVIARGSVLLAGNHRWTATFRKEVYECQR